MNPFASQAKGLVWHKDHETILIEPWGKNSLRVRATIDAKIHDLPGALLPQKKSKSKTVINQSSASLANGKIRVEIAADGHLKFSNSTTGQVLLEEEPLDFTRPPARDYRSLPGGLWHFETKFLPQKGERFYGLGQRTHDCLDQKGCTLELLHRNTHISIPFYVSNKGYGFLWHNPAVGRVELSHNITRWVAEASRQIDYFITAGSFLEIMAQYADATGHSPILPQWAAGFWQCKLRYRTQEELLSVAREYKRRGLPLDIIVIDYFHWPLMGEWKFHPRDWPNPSAMVKELDKMGVKLMVSTWGMTNFESRNYAEMQGLGLLVRSERGLPVHLRFIDGDPPANAVLQHYDATNPNARSYVWKKVREGYYRHGIKLFWLDACEPEFYRYEMDNLRYHIGNGLEVSNLYPLMHQQGFYENLRSEGQKEVVNLCRSAWAGSQRYGTAVWSGDIPSTFEVLAGQVKAGLNIAMSGIPWWTTDIGGFRDGDINSPYFRELIVRWFQYGVFCPLFRLHGVRKPIDEVNHCGAANEVWSFGDEAYGIIKELLFLRERLKPYILAQMKLASTKGIPPMRPMFFDFPNDSKAYDVDDQFLFGPDILVAPVLQKGARKRNVYLPAGAVWHDAWTGAKFKGGRRIAVNAPLDHVPVFLKNGRKLPFRV